MDRLTRPPEVNADLGDYVQTGLANWVRNLLNLSSAHGAAIADLETKLAAGASFSDKFNRSDSTLLGNGWLQGGEGQQLGIMDFAARINNLGIGVGKRYAIAPVTLPGNDMSVQAIVNPAGVAVGAMTSLFLRANSDMTEFVYANIYGKSCYIGRGTRSGNTWSFTDWESSTTIGVSESDVVDFSCVGTTYQLLVNRRPILTHVDISGYPQDASHRKVGFQSETKFVGILPQYSWGLAGFAARSASFADLVGIAAQATQASADASTAVTAAAEAEQAAADALDTSIGVANTVNEYVTSDEAAGVDGQSYYTSFPGPDIDPIWVTTTPGEVEIGNGTLGIHSSGTEGTFAYRFNAAADTDDMAVKCVLASAGVDYANDAHTTLYARLATGGTSFVYCKLFKDRIEIGKGSGAFLTFDTPWATKTITLKAGYTVEFRMVGNVYSVRINGTQVLEATNATATVGASNRFGGVAFSRNNVPPFGYLASARISSWSLLDLTGTAINGSGWAMHRAATASVNPSGSGYQIVPSGVFDTFPTTNNVQVFTASGQIVIQKAGFYSITVGLETAAGVADEGVDRIPCLFKAADIMSPFALFRIGQASTDVRPIACTWTEYLEVGQVLVPGLNGGVRDQITGDTLGTKTYFTGALVSNPVGRKGDKGDKGDQGNIGPTGPAGTGLQITGTVATYAALPAGLGTGDAGKQYYVTADERLYIWLGSAWHASSGNGIPIRGPQGEAGTNGTNGTNVTISRVTTLPGSGTANVIYWIPV